MQQPRGCGTETTDLPRTGGGGASAGLARYRSAPATWLEALLESDDDVVVEIPKPPTTTDIDLDLLESAAAGGLTNFLRQNSSPAEFLSSVSTSDGYFSNLGIPASYDYASLPSAKRAREAEDLDKRSPKSSPSSSTPLKGEKSSPLHGGVGGALDVDMEKLLEDSVMCRVRAKRGCATHPRSIAERVRRTRISDRIRKLQELVPNMDKQTNTADMLEEAVAYVKLLQNQIQELTEHQKNCKCFTNS